VRLLYGVRSKCKQHKCLVTWIGEWGQNRLDKNWEYVGYDLSFKAQMNIYLKNRQHALIVLIDAGGMKSNDCVEDH